MSSRALLRRLLHINKRVQLHSSVIARPIIAASSIQRKYAAAHESHAAPHGSYSQVRGWCSKAGDGEHVITIQDDEDFQTRVLDSLVPVAVDFYADWCGPCKLLGPRLEHLVGDKNGKVILARLNVDDHEQLAMKYSIVSIPTVIGFKNKTNTCQFIGLQDDDNIKAFLDTLIG